MNSTITLTSSGDQVVASSSQPCLFACIISMYFICPLLDGYRRAASPSALESERHPDRRRSCRTTCWDRPTYSENRSRRMDSEASGFRGEHVRGGRGDGDETKAL